MLSRIEIHKKDGGVLTLPIYGPNSYPVLDVTGLDPVKATIVSSTFAQIDGAKLQSSRREIRNIVMRLGINPTNVTGGADVKILRNQLYDFLNPESEIEIKFVDDTYRTLIIKGIVETFESPIFSRQPEAVISILCLEPDFYSDGNIFQGTFISGIYDYGQMNVYYTGTSKSGFEMKFYPSTTIYNLSISVNNEEWISESMFLSFSNGALAPDDVLTISTVDGAKNITLLRNNRLTSLLYSVDTSSKWPRLSPGNNHVFIGVYQEHIPPTPWNPPISSIVTIESTEKFGGV